MEVWLARSSVQWSSNLRQGGNLLSITAAFRACTVCWGTFKLNMCSSSWSVMGRTERKRWLSCVKLLTTTSFGVWRTTCPCAMKSCATQNLWKVWSVFLIYIKFLNVDRWLFTLLLGWSWDVFIRYPIVLHYSRRHHDCFSDWSLPWRFSWQAIVALRTQRAFGDPMFFLCKAATFYASIS